MSMHIRWSASRKCCRAAVNFAFVSKEQNSANRVQTVLIMCINGDRMTPQKVFMMDSALPHKLRLLMESRPDTIAELVARFAIACGFACALAFWLGAGT